MLSHKESYLKEDISKARMNVFEKIVNYTSVFEQIESASPKVRAFEVMPKYSDRRSRRTVTADDIDEIMENIEVLCELPGENFIMAYSDKPDGLLHKFGTDSDEAKEYVLEAEKKVKELAEQEAEDKAKEEKRKAKKNKNKNVESTEVTVPVDESQVSNTAVPTVDVLEKTALVVGELIAANEIAEEKEEIKEELNSDNEGGKQ